MKILVLMTEVFGVGGIQRMNRHVCLALSQFAQQEGHSVRFLALIDGSDAVDERYLVGDFNFCGFQGHKLNFLIASIRDLTMKPDIVYATHVRLAPLAIALKILRPSLRLGIAVYGIDVWCKLPLLNRITLQKADFVTSISKYTSEETVKLHNVRTKNIRLIPPALDPYWISESDDSTQNKISLNLPEGKIILTVSRLAATENYKGVDSVIQAMPAVLKKIPDAYYVIIGTGDDISRLQKLARTMGVKDRVVFVRKQKGKYFRAYYQNCDLFAMPSKGEGFGIVFLEAMFYKKPVIAGDHAGSRDVVEDEISGLLVNHGDVDALSNAIIKLLGDPKYAARVGDAGYQRLMSKFTFDHFKNNIVSTMLESQGMH